MARLIGIAGVARAGKDTFYKYLQYLLKTKGKETQRVALADELKARLDDFLKEHIGISAYTQDSAEKDIIRDILVAYGKAKRIQSNGTYWTGLSQPKIDASLAEGRIPIVTDIRYDAFPEDEIHWCQEKNQGLLIHISRTDRSYFYIKPANADEAQNDPKLQDKADLRICWPTLPSFEGIVEYMREYGNEQRILKLIGESP